MSTAGERARYWRQVPHIDLLPRGDKTSARVQLGRALLLLLLLALVALSIVLARDRSDTEREIDGTRAQLRLLERELSDEQDDIAGLQFELDQRRLEQSALEQAYAAATGGYIDWRPPLLALFDSQVAGISFQSVTADPEGGVTLEAIAADVAAIGRLQARLTEASGLLELRRMSWEADEESLRVTAVFTVKGPEGR